MLKGGGMLRAMPAQDKKRKGSDAAKAPHPLYDSPPTRVATVWPDQRGDRSVGQFELVKVEHLYKLGNKIKRRKHKGGCGETPAFGALDLPPPTAALVWEQQLVARRQFTAHGFKSNGAAAYFMKLFSALAVPVKPQDPFTAVATRGWMSLLEFLNTEGTKKGFNIDQTIMLKMVTSRRSHDNLNTWHLACQFEQEAEERLLAFAMISHPRLGQQSEGNNFDMELVAMILARPLRETMIFDESEWGNLFQGRARTRSDDKEAGVLREEHAWDRMSLLDAVGCWDNDHDTATLDVESKIISLQLLLLAGARVTNRSVFFAGGVQFRHGTNENWRGPIAKMRTMMKLVGSAQERRSKWPPSRKLLFATPRADQPEGIRRLFLQACGGKEADQYPRATRDGEEPTFLRFFRKPFHVCDCTCRPRHERQESTCAISKALGAAF